jgi:hypothetical protein
MSILTAYDKFIQVALKYAFSLFGLPKTGQTIVAKAGDDGTYQKGYPKSGTRFVNNGDGTITDNATGLMWEQKTDDATIHDKDNIYTWNNLFDVFLAALNAGAGFAGYTDWRIPNINELLSINDYGYYNPSVAPAFNSSGSYTRVAITWSSTTRVDTPVNAWTITFLSGSSSNYVKTGERPTRAVRGG